MALLLIWKITSSHFISKAPHHCRLPSASSLSFILETTWTCKRQHYHHARTDCLKYKRPERITENWSEHTTLRSRHVHSPETFSLIMCYALVISIIVHATWSVHIDIFLLVFLFFFFFSLNFQTVTKFSVFCVQEVLTVIILTTFCCSKTLPWTSSSVFNKGGWGSKNKRTSNYLSLNYIMLQLQFKDMEDHSNQANIKREMIMIL